MALSGPQGNHALLRNVIFTPHCSSRLHMHCLSCVEISNSVDFNWLVVVCGHSFIPLVNFHVRFPVHSGLTIILELIVDTTDFFH